MVKIINFLSRLTTIICSGIVDKDYNASTEPIYEFLDTFGPTLLGIVSGLGVIYVIVLMVKYVKAEEAGERDKVKKQAVGAIVSLFVVLLLLSLLYAFRADFAHWLNSVE